MSLTRMCLLRGDLLDVRYVVCRPTHAAAGGIEHVERDTLVLPLRGAYRKHLSRRDEFLADPTQAVFFAAGRPYRISHPTGLGDESLALDFDADVLRDALATAAGVDSLSAIRPHGSLPAAALAGRALLWRRLAMGIADRLEVEEMALLLLGAALGTVRRETPHRAIRERTLREWRRQAEVVRELLVADPARRWTIRELVRHVHASPFHFARLFRVINGASVHEYRSRARMARSLDLLLDTNHGVGAIAMELGFASHSHFTSAFHRAVGVTPAAFRRRAKQAQLRELRTLLLERLGVQAGARRPGC